MRTRAQRLALVGGIVLVQFGLFEAGLRLAGGSEAAPAFQRLFLDDPYIGYRLRPSTTTRFTTQEFSTDIAINSAGVRDEEIGGKAPKERRILVLGDSLVLAVQVPLAQTFCKRLEALLNEHASGLRYRVIDAGVQGYGPVEEALFYQRFVSKLEPDLVLVVTFVANDAIEAYQRAFRLSPGAEGPPPTHPHPIRAPLRRIIRRSVVLQIINQRLDQVRERFHRPGRVQPDLRLLTYATPEVPEVAHGLDISRDAIGRIASDAARTGAKTAIVLMPARLQLDGEEFARMRDFVEPAGYQMDPDAANARFAAAFQPLGLPMLDLLPEFRRASDPRTIFFESTVHLTPAGHELAAEALLRFLDARHLRP
jgi:lysophospholipase L1-like esterase